MANPANIKSGEGWRRDLEYELARLHGLPTDNGNWGPNAPDLGLLRKAAKLAIEIRRNDLPRPIVTATSDRAIHVAWFGLANTELSIVLYPDDEIEWLLRAATGKIETGAVSEINQINSLVDRFLQ